MRHVIVYHNPDQMGPLEDEPDHFGVVTRKPVRNLPGARVWLLVGEGRPRKVYLHSTFVVDEVDYESDEDGFFGAYGETGVRPRPRPRIDAEPWYPAFRRAMGNFAFGLQPLTDAGVIAALERTLGPGVASSGAPDLRSDVLPDDSETVRQQLVEARVGQGKFRQDLIDYWKGCSVTGCGRIDVLIASHIQPWEQSTDRERLDPFNGLLLTPNLDRLFDRRLITFADDGRIAIASSISPDDMKPLGLVPTMRLRSVSDRHRPYLRRHREMFAIQASVDSSAGRSV